MNLTWATDWFSSISSAAGLEKMGNFYVEDVQFEDVTFAHKENGLANLRKFLEVLSPVVDGLDGAGCCGRVVRRDVLIDVVNPALGFLGPRYFCHDRMRRPISSFEMTRFASESASPRSTIT